jgi:hypothetical protein
VYFAHYTPRQIPFSIVTTEATLQIFSFKIVSCEFSWPLYVYGVVAVRDHVDNHRNILFERSRRSAQLVTRDVCIPSLNLRKMFWQTKRAILCNAGNTCLHACVLLVTMWLVVLAGPLFGLVWPVSGDLCCGPCQN